MGGVWNITSDAYGVVTGSLDLDNFSIGCPNQTYTVTGSYAMYSGNYSVNGSGTFLIDTSNPAPGDTPGCDTTEEAHLVTDVPNNGCDITGPSASSLYTDFGYFSTGAGKAPEIPTAETSTHVGWSAATLATVAQWRIVLTGGDFDGRQVHEEQTSGSNSDSCWFVGSSVAQFGPTGGWWNVGFFGTPNQMVDDYVGYVTTAVTYYRQNFRPPCSATAGQEMRIAVSGTSGSSLSYTTGSIGAGLPNYTDVSSSRNGSTVTTTWP